MIAVAIIAVLAFLAYLLSGTVKRATSDGAAETNPGDPRWHEFALAVILLVAISALLVWQVFGSGFEPGGDWRGSPRAVTFFVVMLIAGALGIVAFLVFLVIRGRLTGQRTVIPTDNVAKTPEVAATRIPSAVRLLGLLLFAISLLLVGWIYLPASGQYALMTNLVYPASLAVALVMLFDKASRTWEIKSTAESMREWLLCDAVIVLLVLAYFNLLENVPDKGYASLFWDMTYIALTLTVLWAVDRKASTPRFLIYYGHLILTPIVLLIWRVQQDIATPDTLSWWSSIWPFFGLSVIFFIIEAVAQLIAAARERHVVLGIKDLIFVILYAALLIGAIPAATG